jgi:signal transduction histidine kinase
VSSTLRPQLPRPTVRLRLTVLYGGLFLISGAALVAIIFVVVLHATSSTTVVQAPPSGVNTPGLTAEQAQALAEAARAQLVNQEKAALLVGSGIALAVMAVISMILGWIVAGRILAPLRTITAAARRISATSLDERLALRGPNDEIKELGDTFDELLTRLETSFQSQRRFIANASHELRTPLARQRVIAQVALADPKATVESLRAAHESVLASGFEQESLIEALLTLARGQAGLNRRERLDLSEIVDQVVGSRNPEIKRRQLELRLTTSRAPVTGDSVLVERLVTNLIDNALRHNVENGWLKVACETHEGRGVLSVSNSGAPVMPAGVDELFEPFRRLATDRTGHREGIGLGLSIVRAIADAHAATIRISSRSEGGLEVDVTFPALDTSEAVPTPS